MIAFLMIVHFIYFMVFILGIRGLELVLQGSFYPFSWFWFILIYKISELERLLVVISLNSYFKREEMIAQCLKGLLQLLAAYMVMIKQ